MLKWEQDDKNRYVQYAEFGPFSLNVHSIGHWWVEDDSSENGRIAGGYSPGCWVEQLKIVCMEHFQKHLRMAAETLDSSWLEAATEDTDENNEPVSRSMFDSPSGLNSVARGESKIYWSKPQSSEDVAEWVAPLSEPVPLVSKDITFRPASEVFLELSAKRPEGEHTAKARAELFGIPAWDGIWRSKNYFTGQLVEQCSGCHRRDGAHAADCPVLHHFAASHTLPGGKIDLVKTMDDAGLLKNKQQIMDLLMNGKVTTCPDEPPRTFDQIVKQIMARTLGRNEFVLLNGREPNEEELAKATEWAKNPGPVAQFHDEDEDEGVSYDQISDMIKAEAKLVKL